jgi:hypothetical protein
VSDWPLGVCSVQSVDPDTDLANTDIVFRDGFTENLSVYYNPAQKWYYLHGQRDDELLLFRQSDTEGVLAIGMFEKLGLCFSLTSTGVPHASFKNPQADPSERPRESIEARAFLYYL